MLAGRQYLSTEERQALGTWDIALVPLEERAMSRDTTRGMNGHNQWGPGPPRDTPQADRWHTGPGARLAGV